MNYRLGFQRLYAVLTITWFALLWFALPADRLKFWSAQPDDWVTVHGPWERDPIVAPATLPQGADPIATDPYAEFGGHILKETPTPAKGAIPLPPGATLVDPSHVSPAPPGSVPRTDYAALAEKVRREAPPVPPGYILDQPVTRQPFGESRTGKTIWLAGVLLLPPAVGYLLLFLLIPWIYRGFKPASTQLMEKP